MKKILIISIVLLFAAVSASAQVEINEKRLDSAPRAFRTFFSSFSRAAAKREKAQVAAMTRFPLPYGFDAGDEGTMNRTRFLKEFDYIFDEPFEKNPLFSRGEDGTYVITTDYAAHLNFIKIKGKFMLIGYYVEA